MQGDRSGAIVDYTKAIAVAPNYAYAYNNRGNQRRLGKDPTGAIADFTAAIALDSTYALAYRNRGLAHIDRKESALAVADFTTALRFVPRDATAFLNRGRARQALDDLDGAIADFTAALRVDSTYSSAYVNRTVARGAQGDLAGALADGDSAVKIDPRDPFGYEARAYTRLALHDGAAANVDALESLRLRQGSDSHFAYGVIVGSLGLRQAGRTADAAAFLSTWGSQADSTNWPYAVVRYLERKLSAVALLAKAKDSDEITEARTYLAVDLLLAGNGPAALPHLRWVRDHGTRTYFEYPVALAELRRASGGPAPTRGTPLTGRWAGTVRQSNRDTTYTVTMELHGPTGGTIEYPPLACGGTLTFVEAGSHGLWYREHITHGTTHCLDGGTLQLIPAGAALQWIWSGSGITVMGTLDSLH
jgi:tetratricopeptide (TPR) repeat protein